MFCSDCGEKAGGNFCSACGRKLGDLPTARLVAVTDWRDEVDYEALVAVPEVRDRIARCAARAVQGMTGEKWLELFDKLAGPPVSLKTVAEVARPIYARLGIGTGKSRDEAVPSPVGETIVGVLCSLASNGQAVKQVHQCGDGCVIDAVLPSDLFALEGKLVVTIRRDEKRTRVQAATTIPGQVFDWGKSRRCLDQLFGEIGRAGRAA